MTKKYKNDDPRRIKFSEAFNSLTFMERRLLDSLPYLQTRNAEYAAASAKGQSAELEFEAFLLAKNVAWASTLVSALDDQIQLVEMSAKAMANYLNRYRGKFNSASLALWQMDVISAYERLATAKQTLDSGLKATALKPELQALLTACMDKAYLLAPDACNSQTFPFGG